VGDDYTLEGDASGTGSENGGCGEDFSCVAAVTAGEYARVELSTSLACPEGWAAGAAFSDGSDPGCPCACEKAHGGECEPGTVYEFGSAACGSGDDKDEHYLSESGGCADIYTGASGIALGDAEATQGVCSPVDPAPAPLSMVVCKPSSPVEKSCGSDKVCVPAVKEAPAKLCALLPQGASCPSGFTATQTIHPVSNDSRACDCICGPAEGATCQGGSLEIFSDANCAASLGASFPAGASCYDTAAFDNLASIKVNAGAWTGGECPPLDLHDGSLSVDKASAFTLCCLP
jgi:hypothetical protein